MYCSETNPGITFFLQKSQVVSVYIDPELGHSYFRLVAGFARAALTV
jgi:hypothetical protein